MEGVVAHPERFDPHAAEGRLIDAEHRSRYWWAAQLAPRKNILDAGCGLGYGIEIFASAGASTLTGVDIDAGAVEEAERRVGTYADSLVAGDLQSLPFDDHSFDLVVCFETIEHIEDGERALAELRRVLEPGGLLIVSSPNPDVYPSGNEHHVHEYRPAELAAAVSEHFACVAIYRQHAWLASAIEVAADHDQNGMLNGSGHTRVARTVSPVAGGEAYGIVVAGDDDLPGVEGIVSLGNAFEVKWWAEQVANHEREVEKAIADAKRQVRGAEKRAHDQVEAAKKDARETVRAANEERAAAEARAEARIETAREQIETTREDARQTIAIAERRALEHVQGLEKSLRREVAQAEERERAANERLREASTALLDANQELAQIPVWQHRHAELHEQYAYVRWLSDELMSSRSWRYTAPLRRLWRVLGLRR